MFDLKTRKDWFSSIQRAAACALAIVCVSEATHAQEIKDQIVRGHEMLAEIKKDIQENYFDERFQGLNLKEIFKAADDQISNAVSGDQIYGIIANALLSFQDSHTFFIPPVWSMDVDYGWEMQMFGDKCYVTSVESNSDAEAKGLQAGDRVLAIFDVPVDRDNLWQLEYLFRDLRPVNPIRIRIASRSGTAKQLDVTARVRKATWQSIGEKQRLARLSIQKYLELEGDVFLWKMPEFDLDRKGVDGMMTKVRAHKALVLDLRGNAGGYEETLQYLLGYFFDRDVKIGDLKGRKEVKPLNAKSRQSKTYHGKLIVLVDSRSASAAEIFARVVQLEHRGTVLGDRTAGAVTEAREFIHDYVRRKGFLVSALAVQYGVSVTVNNLIMTDGKSLERTGVTPDELILPTPADLSVNADPILKRAGQILEVTIAPEI